jgi:hypothetical protein
MMVRKRIEFWLFPNDSSDKVVLRVIKSLKKRRLFRQTVIDGIMILHQLIDGKTELLFKRFPWIVDNILANAPPPATNTVDLERQIADLKRILLEQGSISAPPANYPQSKSSSAPPVVEKKIATLATADEISSNFLNFIQ